jgi:hypothetical protein
MNIMEAVVAPGTGRPLANIAKGVGFTRWK